MRIIKPITMTDSILLSSNVSENDHAEWDASTTYDAEDFVISVTTHSVYQSVQGANLGNDPTTDDGTWWVLYSATNRWKAFDGKLADQVTRTGTISYSFEVSSIVTGIAFFGLSAAQIRVQVYDLSAVEVYDETISLVDDSDIVDWFTFFTTELSNVQTSALVTGLPAYPGYQIDVTIGDGVGTTKVGEIAMGNARSIGEVLEGTEIGLTSFSTKEQDSFGNWTIVSRAKSDPVTYQIEVAAGDYARVKRILDDVRDTPAVYFAGDDMEQYGTTTYGFFQDYRLVLANRGFTINTLEIEGLT